jgi:phosphoenolpyruvate phosphomutase / 2-hydroxyethylphosphonate cytidylyltransferase
MATVYIGMSIDILHHGHINVIQHGRKLGKVIIGLLVDEAIADHKRLPYLTYGQRKKIAENILGVEEVVPQKEWDYSVNLKKYKPDYMVHGDDWIEGPLAPYRRLAIKALDEYGGKLIEIPYTVDVSSSEMSKQIQAIGTTPENRKQTLKRLLRVKPIVRFMEAHNPLSALIAEHAQIQEDGKLREFDGFWSSSLTDSTSMGKPDIEALDISNRLTGINNIFEVTTKPLIMDADTGGKPEHFEINVRSMERLGISAVIIEDKTGLKKNSLFGNEVSQTQESIESFCAKIRAGRASRVNSDFMVIARIESLILEQGMDDAVSRARAYVEAGADAIMIHSRKKQPDEVFSFASIFRGQFEHIPLVCVPTSYSHVTEDELAAHGFNIVIYANHLLRAAYPAMKKAALGILQDGRSSAVEKNLISIKEILELIPGTK